MARTEPKHIHYAPVIFSQGNTFPNEHQEADIAALYEVVPQMTERNVGIISTALRNTKEKLQEERKMTEKKERDAMKMLKEIEDEMAKRIKG